METFKSPWRECVYIVCRGHADLVEDKPVYTEFEAWTKEKAKQRAALGYCPLCYTDNLEAENARLQEELGEWMVKYDDCWAEGEEFRLKLEALVRAVEQQHPELLETTDPGGQAPVPGGG